MKRIRILQVVGGMNRGGAETFLMNVLRNIDKQKFEFFFLCYGEGDFDYSEEITSLGAKIVRIPDVKVTGALKHIKNIEEIIKDEQIDIVHAHTAYNSMFSVLAGKRAGIRAIVHSHTTESEMNPSLLRNIYFKFSKFIVNTYSTDYFACGHDAGTSLFYKRNKFTIIDNGIILDNFYYNRSLRTKLRKELGIANSSFVLLHVGRFDKIKNHEFLIDTYREYRKLNASSTLLLIGDGPLRPELEKKVSLLGMKKDVLFLGKQPNVNELYNVADILVFPSFKEGLPVTLIEAQANGLLSLISDSIDKATKLTGCIHFFSLSNDAAVWADKITTLDPHRLDTKKTLENGAYDMKKNVKKIERLYTKSERYQ